MKVVEYQESVIVQDGMEYALVREGVEKFLRVKGNAEGFAAAAFERDGAQFFPLGTGNAAQLRKRLPHLRPAPLGLKTTFGFGDRLGLATRGHIQAARPAGIASLFAQQSVRENTRTGRSPQEVVDDAMWGAFQCGWREPWGADADHLKTTNDIAPFVAAGYTFFTVDPGEHVDNAAPTDDAETLKTKVRALPWDVLDDSYDGLRARYIGKTFDTDGLNISLTEETLLRAAAKYGKALAHAVRVCKEIARQKGSEFDFEVSVDETELPTSIAEHFYIASELARLNVRATSLAPRFVGRFEKGVDFIGDLDALRENLNQHAAVARHFNYKLSLHSGSDKLSVYPLFAESTRGLAHVKTAGTSYLEALRTFTIVNPRLFREIMTLARERYPVDRATYHVSAQVKKVRASSELSDAQLPELLNEFDAREVLHVTFGSALAKYRGEIYKTLRENETEYANTLERHFKKHLEPFQRSPLPLSQ
jgi:hypothetical protein